MNRRTFLKASAGASILTAAGGAIIAAQNYGGKNVPIALQLYTIGGDLRRDMAGSLERVAKLGYKGVEFAGFNNVAAGDIRKMLDGAVTSLGLGVQSPRANHVQVAAKGLFQPVRGCAARRRDPLR